MRIARYMTAAFLLTSSSLAFAGTLDEIQNLLRYIESSGCEFERNGTVYDSEQARSHIERKYDYIESRVDNAEDFIKYAATESSISGKKYHVVCNGERQTSAEWLQDELSRYRENPIAAARVEQKAD
jgi:hypothetical protein